MLFFSAQSSGNVYRAMMANQAHFGRFVSTNAKRRNRDVSDLAFWHNWCLDNGAFNGFSQSEFFGFLKSCLPYRSNCRFVVVPDVPFNWQATLNKFGDWHRSIARLGFPRAIAVQDGATVNDVPWNDIEAVFIGGSTIWKREHYADLPMFAHVLTPRDEIMREAKRRGMWVHMGRQANGIKQLQQAALMGACSVDGTGEIYKPNKYFKWIAQTIWEINLKQ